jgi:hypothetical protein
MSVPALNWPVAGLTPSPWQEEQSIAANDAPAAINTDTTDTNASMRNLSSFFWCFFSLIPFLLFSFDKMHFHLQHCAFYCFLLLST